MSGSLPLCPPSRLPPPQKWCTERRAVPNARPMKFEPGEKVVVIHDTVRGIVKAVNGERVLIEDEDGFERDYRSSELTVWRTVEEYPVDSKLLKKETLRHRPRPSSRPSAPSHVIDLHIEALTADHSRWTNHEILMRQLSACKEFIQGALRRRERKIVLIHGKGQGVLKAEIHLHLHQLREVHGLRLQYHEASFSDYGRGGATEVIFYKG